jgi:hypothetical protein
MVDLYPSENCNAWNLLSVRHFVYKLLFHVHLPRFGDILIWIDCRKHRSKSCSKKNYEQTGTKATEIHSHHCLYCDTRFPQFDDLIKHSRENHCYYCKTTFVLFEKVIKHSTENHGSLMLKVKYLELNPSSEHYGYKSHNFNVIPEKIKALVPVCS